MGVPRSATYTPIFQCFVDYRQGARINEKWGDCQLELLSFEASKSAYDLALDVIDDPDGECLLMLVVREDLYKRRDAEILMASYEALITSFTNDVKIVTSKPDIFRATDVEQALKFGRG